MKDWELILNKGKKRVYKLNFKVRQFKRPGGSLGTVKELFSGDIWLPSHLEIIDDTEAIDKVCISDANDHVERLVFPVVYAIDKRTGAEHLFINPIVIDGYMTPLTLIGYVIGYGYAKTIHKDEVYLRHLRMLNKCKEVQDEKA